MDGGYADHKAPLCVIRPLRSSDLPQLNDVINVVAMETVGEYMWASVFSELFPTMAFMTVAVGFLGFYLPMGVCLASIPAALVVIYGMIYSGHLVKALELHSELRSLHASTQSNADSFLWVAEVHDNRDDSQHAWQHRKTTYTFITEKEMDERAINIDEYSSHKVVGCCGVFRSNKCLTRAWLRLLMVEQQHRRRGIATQLLETAQEFAMGRNYKGMDLIVTDCHQKARTMFCKEGFEAVLNNRSILMVSQQIYNFSKVFRPKQEDNSS